MKVVILATKGEFTNFLYNDISKVHEIDWVLTEDSVSKRTMLQKRIRKLGLTTVIGQIGFKLLIEPLLMLVSKNRIKDIISTNNLNSETPPLSKQKHFSTVNSSECIEAITEIQPDIILVMGTRIISKKVLDSTNAIFINMHMGITPLYRGVHGAYWALAEQDKDHCGVTVHFVDKGIDTGAVIYQDKINICTQDTFVTYPYLQLVQGLALLRQAIEDAENGKITTKTIELPSKLRTHPTLTQYLYFLFTRRVR